MGAESQEQSAKQAAQAVLAAKAKAQKDSKKRRDDDIAKKIFSTVMTQEFGSEESKSNPKVYVSTHVHDELLSDTPESHNVGPGGARGMNSASTSASYHADPARVEKLNLLEAQKGGGRAYGGMAMATGGAVVASDQALFGGEATAQQQRLVADQMRSDQERAHEIDGAGFQRGLDSREKVQQAAILMKDQVERKFHMIFTYRNPDSIFAQISTHPTFENAIACVVCCNAGWIGVELEFNQNEPDYRRMDPFFFVENVFCVIFVRLIADHCVVVGIYLLPQLHFHRRRQQGTLEAPDK